MSSDEKQAVVEKALLSVGEVAGMLNICTRSVYRMADAGKMPKPIKLGALVRWDKGVLENWIADGCPQVRP